MTLKETISEQNQPDRLGMALADKRGQPLLQGRGGDAVGELEGVARVGGKGRTEVRRTLAKGRRVIQVIPQGIPQESELQPALLAACRNGQALLLSPQPPGSRLNKKVATWCNEYVLRHADEIWRGDISPNGMLATMLRALGR